MIGLLYDINHEKKTMKSKLKYFHTEAWALRIVDESKIILAQINNYKLINIYNTQCPR